MDDNTVFGRPWGLSHAVDIEGGIRGAILWFSRGKSGDLKGGSVSRVQTTYSVGDVVKIIDGPFASFSGKVEDISPEKEKLRVSVQIFGRATSVELDLKQVISDNNN